MLGDVRDQDVRIQTMSHYEFVDLFDISQVKRGPANLSLFLKVVLLYEYLTKCKKQGQFKNLHLKCS